MFLFQCFQGTDGTHVVLKLGLLAAFAQVIVRDSEILSAFSRRFQRIHHFLSGLFCEAFLCLLRRLQRFCPERPVPFVTVQQRSQNRFAFRTENGINHGRIPEGDIKESHLIDREGPVIHIDCIAWVQIISKGRFCRWFLRMP